jgi:hypothetical protein
MTLEPRIANLEALFAYMVETQSRMAENMTTLTQVQAQMAESQIRHDREIEIVVNRMDELNERTKVQEGQIKILIERLLVQRG